MAFLGTMKRLFHVTDPGMFRHVSTQMFVDDEQSCIVSEAEICFCFVCLLAAGRGQPSSSNEHRLLSLIALTIIMKTEYTLSHTGGLKAPRNVR